MKTALKLKKKTKQSLIHAHALVAHKAKKYDPTHTTAIRNAFARDCRKRFANLCRVIQKSIVDEDCFGLNPDGGGFAAHASMVTTGRLAFDYPRSAEKVNEFMKWVDKQIQAGILETTTRTQLGRAVEEAWQNQYVTSAYQKGILRARQEMASKGYDVPSIPDASALYGAFNQPFHMDRVGLIYSRVYSGLKGITALMDTQISRVLAQGMADGDNPRVLARLLTKTITGPVGDLSLTDTLGRFIPAERRAEVLARTEIIRAHHEATMQEYRNYGVEGVNVEVEWMTAGDDRVCDECASMEGQVFTLDEADGMIPVHPQCRCCAVAIPASEEARGGEATAPDEEGTTPFIPSEGIAEGEAAMAIEEGGGEELIASASEVSDVPAFLQQHSAPFSEISKEDLAKITEYTRSSGPVNESLREGTVIPPGPYTEFSGEEVASALDRAFSVATPLQEDTILYRVIDLEKGEAVDWLELEKGGLLKDKGFMSTTTDINAAKRFAEQLIIDGVDMSGEEAVMDTEKILLKLVVPKGTPALSFPAGIVPPNYAYQHEILLPRGLEFKYVGPVGGKSISISGEGITQKMKSYAFTLSTTAEGEGGIAREAVAVVKRIESITPFTTIDEGKIWLKENGVSTISSSKLSEKDILNRMNSLKVSITNIKNEGLTFANIDTKLFLSNDATVLTNAGKKVAGVYSLSENSIKLSKSIVRKVDSLTIAGKNTFNVCSDFQGLFRHEFGHYIFDNVLTTIQKDDWSFLVANNPGAIEKISYYASTKSSEAFAESFSAYTAQTYDRAAKFGSNHRLPQVVEEFFDSLFK